MLSTEIKPKKTSHDIFAAGTRSVENTAVSQQEGLGFDLKLASYTNFFFMPTACFRLEIFFCLQSLLVLIINVLQVINIIRYFVICILGSPEFFKKMLMAETTHFMV